MVEITVKRPVVSKTKDYFEVGEKGFFYLADTVWNAFSNASLEEWEEYLDYRRQQNKNWEG